MIKHQTKPRYEAGSEGPETPRSRLDGSGVG